MTQNHIPVGGATVVATVKGPNVVIPLHHLDKITGEGS